jgi:23S rRNA-/tRNA-specific pseudouridylate synthase
MVWAVHQLDADTSGLNVFVTRKSLVSVVAQRLRWPKGRKLYAAVCHGEPTFDSKIVEAPIGHVSARRLGVTPEGKPCASAVTTLCRAFGFSLVRVELRTGRTHQIRIHLSHLGHPLVGEPFYRAPPCELLPRHALHAYRLELAGDEPLVLRADLPADLQELCDRLGLKARGLEG